jgi:protein-S-isoprenylcysteine O-methyltransferase Ste14
MTLRIEGLNAVFEGPYAPVQVVVWLIISVCVLAILVSILIDFIFAEDYSKAKTEKKSVVQTGTMLLFFVLYYLIIKSHFGEIEISNIVTHLSLAGIGLAMIIVGTVVNISGRLYLGKNWANQIKIYPDQTLVVSGPFRLVRHPLYASLIWMFFAGSLIYLNLAALAANALIFVPFMFYRAKQEEKILAQGFKDYTQYQKKVGMFFPKLAIIKLW